MATDAMDDGTQSPDPGPIKVKVFYGRALTSAEIADMRELAESFWKQQEQRKEGAP